METETVTDPPETVTDESETLTETEITEVETDTKETINVPIGYVRVGLEDQDFVELPAEANGSLLLATIRSQFPNAAGLRFKTEAGLWRGIRITETNVLDPPLEGWGNNSYQVVLPENLRKRKAEGIEEVEDETALEKMKKMTEEEILSDLVVLSLPFEAQETEVENYFKLFGDVELCEIKYDSNGKSRGFGFIRFGTVEAVRKCLGATHMLRGREIEVCWPKEKAKDDGTPTKLFIGRLPKGVTNEEFKEYFERFGVVKDAYVKEPFCGYGFVSFKKTSVAKKVLNSTHVLKGQYLNVSHATKRKNEDMVNGSVPVENSDWNGGPHPPMMNMDNNIGRLVNMIMGGNQGYGNPRFANRGGGPPRHGGPGPMRGGMGHFPRGMFPPPPMAPRGPRPHGGGMEDYYGVGFTNMNMGPGRGRFNNRGRGRP